MIELIDYKSVNRKGFVIKYDDKAILFNEEETEEIRIFLNNRGLESRILKALEDENSTIEEITMRLGLDTKSVRNEIIRLEDEGQVVSTENKRRVCHKDLGLIFVPIYELCEDIREVKT